jgi:hypothetical protein
MTKGGPQRISGSKAPKNEITTATHVFPESGNSVVILVMFHPETGSEKFKIAAAKLDVPLSQLPYKIGKKFQLLSACSGGRGTRWR